MMLYNTRCSTIQIKCPPYKNNPLCGSYTYMIVVIVQLVFACRISLCRLDDPDVKISPGFNFRYSVYNHVCMHAHHAHTLQLVVFLVCRCTKGNFDVFHCSHYTSNMHVYQQTNCKCMHGYTFHLHVRYVHIDALSFCIQSNSCHCDSNYSEQINNVGEE